MNNLRVETAALEYKVLVLGNTQVGKSSIIRRYTTGEFPCGMLSTIGELIFQIYEALDHRMICVCVLPCYLAVQTSIPSLIVCMVFVDLQQLITEAIIFSSVKAILKAYLVYKLTLPKV